MHLSCWYRTLSTVWEKDKESITMPNPANKPCNCSTNIKYNNSAVNIELVINVTSDRDYGVYTCTARTYMGEKRVITAYLQSESL